MIKNCSNCGEEFESEQLRLGDSLSKCIECNEIKKQVVEKKRQRTLLINLGGENMDRKKILRIIDEELSDLFKIVYDSENNEGIDIDILAEITDTQSRLKERVENCLKTENTERS